MLESRVKGLFYFPEGGLTPCEFAFFLRAQKSGWNRGKAEYIILGSFMIALHRSESANAGKINIGVVRT